MVQKINIAKQIAAAALLLAPFTKLNAQNDWKSWNSVNVSVQANPQLDLRLGHLRAFNMTEKFRSEFSQTQFSANYDLNKRTDIGAGIMFIKPAGNADTRVRVFVRGSYSTRVARVLRWTNTLQLETNSKQENRFRQRAILTTRLATRKRLDFLNLTPAVSYSLFYNVGGNPITYFNNEGLEIARQTPDGFHRSRFTFSLNSKISDVFRITAFVMTQREFNLLTPETRKMNVFNPVRNRIVRPFDNYQVFGLSLNVAIDDLINAD